jgi:hypothetical protein
LHPGHVVSFVTDENGIVENSCISLRNDAMVNGKRLKYQLSNQTVKQGFVHTVKFMELKDELDKYLFNRAKDYRERYLLGLQLKSWEIGTLVDRVRLVKSMYSCEEYIIHSGTVNDVEVEAVNCVTGFYRGAGVVGTESDPSSRRQDWDRGVGTPDPSPQMSAWSYLAYIWDLGERDRFLEKTKVRELGVERVHDDQLKAWNPKTTPPPGGSRGPNPQPSMNIRQYTTMPQTPSWDHPAKPNVSRGGRSWQSIWESLSENDKLQSAMVSDHLPNAEVAYYKGLSLQRFWS